MRTLPFAAFVVLALCAPLARAACREHPFAHVGASARAFVAPGRLALVAGAVAAPLVLSPIGADHAIRVVAQRELDGRYDREATTLVIPYALVAASATSVLITRIAGDCEGTRIASALLQSTLIAAGLSATLKLAFGRGYPTGGADPYAADRLDDSSRATRWRGPPDFGAWPSGHSAVAFAFASALRATLPRAGLLRFAGYALAGGIGVGMIWGDHHWTSDVISGALLGEALGSAIGTGFRRREAGWALVPMPGGAAIAGSF